MAKNLIGRRLCRNSKIKVIHGASSLDDTQCVYVIYIYDGDERRKKIVVKFKIERRCKSIQERVETGINFSSSSFAISPFAAILFVLKRDRTSNKEVNHHHRRRASARSLSKINRISANKLTRVRREKITSDVHYQHFRKNQSSRASLQIDGPERHKKIGSFYRYTLTKKKSSSIVRYIYTTDSLYMRINELSYVHDDDDKPFAYKWNCSQ